MACTLLAAGALPGAHADPFRCTTGAAGTVNADDEFQALCKVTGSCDAAQREHDAGHRCVSTLPSDVPREFVCKASSDSWAAVPDPLYLRTAPPQLERRARDWYGGRFGSTAADCMPTAQYVRLKATQRGATAPAAAADSARGGPAQSPSKPTSNARAPSTSPWIDAVNENNATGPCVAAEQTCLAACGNPRDIGSKDGFRFLECRTGCTKQRSMCALAAAEPYAGGAAR